MPKLVEVWHDGKIKPGDEWEPVIMSQIKGADIILLLISVDFINSSFCYDKEMDVALERHDRREATVIPVIIRNCLWHHAPFAKLKALPTDGKAVRMWDDSDEAYTNVAEGIRSVANDLLNGG